MATTRKSARRPGLTDPVAAHSRRATRALQKLTEVDPAIAALALWCRHLDADVDGPPAISDHVSIRYLPGFERLDLDRQMGVCAHHVLHVAFRHAARSKALSMRFGAEYRPAHFTLAADALINETLVLAGHVLPRPFVRARDLPGNPASSPEDAVGNWDAERLYLALVHGSDGGSEARIGALEDYAAQQGHRDDLDPGGDDGDTGETGPEAWTERIARALDTGRGAGRGIGALGIELADLPEMRTPWEQVLRGLLARALAPVSDVTWRRPSHQWLALDSTARETGGAEPVFQPGVAREALIPRIAVAVDCSGSIDENRLRLFAVQVAGIGRRTGAEVHILAFDEQVRARRKMGAGRWEVEILSLEFGRGGGTDFKPVLAEASGLDPAIIVVLTDLEGPFGDPPGTIPVLWAVPSPPATKPPFGRTLELTH